MKIRSQALLVTVVLAASFLIGCGAKQTAGISYKENSENNIKRNHKNTDSNIADDNEPRDISADLKVVNFNDYERTEDIVSSNEYVIPADLDVIGEHSNEIIEGTIEKVTYIVIGGDAWTKVDIAVTKSIKGSLKSGDNVSVYQQGGYVPLVDHIKFYDDAFRYSDLSDNEINATVLKETVDGEPLPEVGERAVYFLERFSNDSILNGQYGRTRGRSSVLKYNGNGRYLYYKDANDSAREISLKSIKESSRGK